MLGGVTSKCVLSSTSTTNKEPVLFYFAFRCGCVLSLFCASKVLSTCFGSCRQFVSVICCVSYLLRVCLFLLVGDDYIYIINV